jgi:hypothetical protein
VTGRPWLRAAATLVAIRVAFWLLAALALVWAPAVAGRRIGDAYGGWTDLLVRTFAQWDAVWFVQIALNGYDDVPAAAAFFPLYPALVHALAWATGSILVAGVLLSLASAAVAAAILAELARPLLGRGGARDTVLYLALYPVAFVFCAVYSDALFLALAAGAFLAAQRGQSLLAGILGGLATATRLVGLALLPALALLLARGGAGRRERALRLLPLLLLPAAVGLYALHLDRELGDAWAFTSAQAGWERSLSPLGPLGGLVDAVQAAGRGARVLATLPYEPGHEHRVALWNVSHLGLLAAVGWLTWVAWRRLGPAHGSYALATLVIVLSVPAEGFPLVSLPRFVLADFPLFLALAAVTADRPRARDAVLWGFGAVGAAAAIAFSRGVWIA